jgi:hypothetical protein
MASRSVIYGRPASIGTMLLEILDHRNQDRPADREHLLL